MTLKYLPKPTENEWIDLIVLFGVFCIMKTWRRVSWYAMIGVIARLFSWQKSANYSKKKSSSFWPYLSKIPSLNALNIKNSTVKIVIRLQGYTRLSNTFSTMDNWTVIQWPGCHQTSPSSYVNNFWAVCPCTICLLHVLGTGFDLAELSPY